MTTRSRLRLYLLQSVVVAAVLTLLARLWFLQVADPQEFVTAAQENAQREVVTTAARGQVVDDLGRPLVRNRLALVVTVDRRVLLEQPDDGDAELQRLAEVLGTTVEDLTTRIRLCGDGVEQPCWSGSPYQPIPVADDVAPEVALQLAERAEQFPGVTAQPGAVREYPQQGLAGAALGYLAPATEQQIAERGLRGRDLVGSAGVEAVYDQQLRGQDGVQQLAVDSDGRVTGTVGEVPARQGDTLVLSLDAGIQQVAERALADGVQNARSQRDRLTGQRYKADAGAVVVLEAQTGRVVALADYPTYDPSVWVGGISPQDYAALTDEEAGSPLVPRAWQGQYAPASTFKPITMIAALKSGNSLTGSYDCPGSKTFGSRSFRNFDSAELGTISLRTALIKSCDTIFYQFAYDEWVRDGGLDPEGEGRVPKEQFVRTAENFGLGSRTGVDLPSEASGRVADRAYKQQLWDAQHETWCAQAEDGFSDVAKTDRQRAAYLTQIAEENCQDGMQYRAGDAVNFSIGQGDTVVSPLQLAVAYAAIANGGTVHAPRVAKALVGPDGQVREEITPPVKGRLDTDARTLAYIRDALSEVGVTGTAAAAFAGFPFGQLSVAGKTGTAQVANKQDTSWFASFAPTDDAKYVVVAMISQGGQGAESAAPVVANVYRGIYGLGTPAAQPCGGDEVALPQVDGDGGVAPPCEVPAGTPAVDAPPPAGSAAASAPPAAPEQPTDGATQAAAVRASGTGADR